MISENIIKGLQLLRIKDKHNISEAAFNEILKVLGIPGVSLYKLQKLLGDFVPLKPKLVDCCINSCVTFTGELANVDLCPECEEPCYKFGEIDIIPIIILKMKGFYCKFFININNKRSISIQNSLIH